MECTLWSRLDGNTSGPYQFLSLHQHRNITNGDATTTDKSKAKWNHMMCGCHGDRVDLLLRDGGTQFLPCTRLLLIMLSNVDRRLRRYRSMDKNIVSVLFNFHVIERRFNTSARAEELPWFVVLPINKQNALIYHTLLWVLIHSLDSQL